MHLYNSRVAFEAKPDVGKADLLLEKGKTVVRRGRKTIGLTG